MMIVDCIEPSLDEVVILSYEGDMHEGGEGGPNSIYYDGAGTASLSNGCRYEGSFRKGMFHGKGVLSWSDGVKFEGSFESGRLNGKGAYEWHDGSTYVGSIRNGLRHGNGKFTGSSGQSYEGEWSSGKRSGQGKLWYNEEHSVMYTGEWMDNERHGYGTMKYASGSSYEGQWAYDKKCGSGVMVWKVNTTASDEVYTGEWKDDLPHGLGEHVWGEAAGRSMKKECCNIYRGSFQAGRRHGKGSFFYMNGSQYTGDWVADEKHGEGVFVYPDGRISVGRYEHNRSVPLKKVKKVKGDEEVEEGSAAAALVAPQFQLFVDDLYDLLPSQLLQLHSSSSSQQQQKQQQTGVMTESELKALEIKEMEHKARETKEMERLLLKYNQSLRAALNRYTDFSVRGRTRSDALLQTQQLQSFSPTNDAGRLYKACAVARSFHKRIFSMNLENALRFLRECGLVGTGGYLYSYDVCLILRRMRRAMTLVTMQKVLSFKRDVIHEEERQRRIEAEAKQAMQQQLAAMMALQQQQQQQEKLVGRRSQSMGLKSSSNSPRGGGGFTTTTTTAAGAVVSKSVSLDTSVPAISVSLDEEEEAAAQAQAQAQAAEKKEEEEEEAAAVAASRRRIEAVDEEEFDLLHTFRVNSIRDSYLHPESSPQQHHHQQQHHHHQHHQQPTALVFDFQPSQPLLDWEVVQLFVRTATEWYLRAKLHLNDDASPDMSLTQVLYYVLARKLLPLTSSNFDAAIPAFYSYFYNDDIQSLLVKSAFFQKLWQHLLSNTDYSDTADVSSTTTTATTTSLYGHTLGPMHSATATEYNIHDAEGGFTRVGQLLQFLTTRRGHLISAHASEVDLLRTMECCPPAVYQYPPADDDDADAEVVGDADAEADATGNAVSDAEAVAVAGGGGDGDGTDEEKGEEKQKDEEEEAGGGGLPKPTLPWIDVSSAGRCIDYSDFLDMLCRVVFSDWWTYSAAAASSSSAQEQQLQLEGEASELSPPPFGDTSQNMAKEELLYTRLLTFSLTFNVDELTSSRL